VRDIVWGIFWAVGVLVVLTAVMDYLIGGA
jgi:hypothetical protein